MGTPALNMESRLFWLGRYAERVYSSIDILFRVYDRLIDGNPIDYEGYCAKMGIPCPYKSGEDFFRRYYFSNDEWSIYSAVENMLGNGMMLRETISTPTLAYLQMAHNAMLMAEASDAPEVELQWVQDDIMAFRGSFDERVDDESNRNITKIGAIIEKISIILRMNPKADRLEKELGKLLGRLERTNIIPEKEPLEIIKTAVKGEAVDPRLLLKSVEGLFRL